MARAMGDRGLPMVQQKQGTPQSLESRQGTPLPVKAQKTRTPPGGAPQRGSPCRPQDQPQKHQSCGEETAEETRLEHSAYPLPEA